jgi:quercetin dioxygenase-like cupin family protein
MRRASAGSSSGSKRICARAPPSAALHDLREREQIRRPATFDPEPRPMKHDLPALDDHVRFDPPQFAVLGMKPELVVGPADDERLWIVLEPNVWFRPLFFDMNNGSHGEVLRVRRGGVLSRHKHSTPVHGFVLEGRWRYLEHSWVACKGSYVMEPPGEIHTLVVDDDDEMQTVFIIQGPTLYLDDADRVVLIEDNFHLITLAREHYEKVGLGAAFVDRFVR